MARKEITNGQSGADFISDLNANYLELYNTVTAGSIKALYESNADTNEYSDADVLQLASNTTAIGTNTTDIATLDARTDALEVLHSDLHVTNVYYATPVSQDITEAGVTLTYFDTSNTVIGTDIVPDIPTQKITVTSGGLYRFMFNISAEFAATEEIILSFYVNGVEALPVGGVHFNGLGASKPILLAFNSIVELNTNDEITIHAKSVVGGGTFSFLIQTSYVYLEKTIY